MRIKLFIPVFIFFVMAGFLLVALGKDPSKLPSPLIGKPLPAFSLVTLANLDKPITPTELKGDAFLLNIWATWCVTCLVEHPFFVQLAKKGVNIVGVNYKDDPGSAIKWLEKHGDPYSVVVVDRNGRFGFDLGVTGAPETYLVDSTGTILYRHVGVVNEKVWQAHFAETFGLKDKNLAVSN